MRTLSLLDVPEVASRRFVYSVPRCWRSARQRKRGFMRFPGIGVLEGAFPVEA
jgi:hypothetical protein